MAFNWKPTRSGIAWSLSCNRGHFRRMHPGFLREARQPASSLRNTYCPANASYYRRTGPRTDSRDRSAAGISLRQASPCRCRKGVESGLAYVNQLFGDTGRHAPSPPNHYRCVICAPRTLEDTMDEKNPRLKQVARLGLISFGHSKADCTIRSISAFGAALDLAADEKIPDEFALTVIPDGDRRRCAVVWRKEKRVAVAFY
ncbi:hypothetical protein ACVWWI_002766 [Bradyrhizobium sp. USDA 3686]